MTILGLLGDALYNLFCLVLMATIMFAPALLLVWSFTGFRNGPIGTFIGRIDNGKSKHNFYIATNPLQAPYVHMRWAMRMARLAGEGRLYMVKGEPDMVHYDDYEAVVFQMPRTVKTHFLRVRHNSEIHDLQHDAIAIEFASEAEFIAFNARHANKLALA